MAILGNPKSVNFHGRRADLGFIRICGAATICRSSQSTRRAVIRDDRNVAGSQVEQATRDRGNRESADSGRWDWGLEPGQEWTSAAACRAVH